MSMTNRDRADWFCDMRHQDELWKMGYEKGRQDRVRSWAEVGAGYLIGKQASGFGTLFLVALVVFLIFLAIKFWVWIALFFLARFAFKVGRYWWSQMPKQTRDPNEWDREENQF